MISLSFLPVWANPLWRGLPMGSEREQILRLLRETLVSLPRAVLVEVTSPPTSQVLKDILASVSRRVILLSFAACDQFWLVILQSGGFFSTVFSWIPMACWMGSLFVLGVLQKSWMARRCEQHPFPGVLGVADASPSSVTSEPEPATETGSDWSLLYQEDGAASVEARVDVG